MCTGVPCTYKYKCRVIFSTLSTFQSTVINNSSLHIEIQSQDENWAYYFDGYLPASDDDQLWIKGSLTLIKVYGNGFQHMYHLWHFLIRQQFVVKICAHKIIWLPKIVEINHNRMIFTWSMIASMDFEFWKWSFWVLNIINFISFSYPHNYVLIDSLQKENFKPIIKFIVLTEHRHMECIAKKWAEKKNYEFKRNYKAKFSKGLCLKYET